MTFYWRNFYFKEEENFLRKQKNVCFLFWRNFAGKRNFLRNIFVRKFSFANFFDQENSQKFQKCSKNPQFSFRPTIRPRKKSFSWKKKPFEGIFWRKSEKCWVLHARSISRTFSRWKIFFLTGKFLRKFSSRKISWEFFFCFLENLFAFEVNNLSQRLCGL